MDSRARQLPQVPPAAGYGLAVAGVAAITGLLKTALGHTHFGNISLIYLLFILVLAVFAGSGPAILAAALAFFAFDWFFVPPVGHLDAAGLDGWLALCLFLVVGVLTGQLTARLRNRAEVAHRRAQEVSALYELSVAILGDAELSHILQVITLRLVRTVGARHALLFLVLPDAHVGLVAEAGERVDGEARAAYAAEARRVIAAASEQDRRGAARAARPTAERGQVYGGQRVASGVCFAPIVLGARPLGAIAACWGMDDGSAAPVTAEQLRLLHAFAAQAALAVGRARFAEEEERARQVAASERMKSVFLASVSHDLRTPLTTIRTAAAGLRQALEGHVTSPIQELLTSIDAEADRLNRLVENLVEMSRIEAEGLPPRKVPEDLAEIIGTVAHRLRALLAARTLSLHVPEDLPPVPLDAIQIDRVLSNLFENAVKFSPSGSVIRLDVWPADGRVYLCIHNQGPALSAQEQARVFDKFYRSDASTDTVRGTGLGLAICKGIIESHGGCISAENDADGVGFILWFPLAAVPGEPPLLPVGAGP